MIGSSKEMIVCINILLSAIKKIKKQATIFTNYSLGVATNRDAWVYNSSKTKLEKNIKAMIAFYNQELERYNNSPEKVNQPANKQAAEKYIAKFINNDPLKISWTRGIRYNFSANKSTVFYKNKFIESLYRPFTKTNCYFCNQLNEVLSLMPKIFPEDGLENLVIGVTGRGANRFSCLISNVLADLNFLEAGGQCFPLKLYEPLSIDASSGQSDLFASSNSNIITAASGKQYTVQDGISDAGLQHFTDFYNDVAISKEDLFYYIYGLFHAADYKQCFADNLTKDLPHIPRVKKLTDFMAFAQAGRKLADLHINYENKAAYPVSFAQGQDVIDKLPDDDFYVEKMKFKHKQDKSTIIYNSNITINDIPLEAYNYIVNGKSAIEWVDGQTKHNHAQRQPNN